MGHSIFSYFGKFDLVGFYKNQKNKKEKENWNVDGSYWENIFGGHMDGSLTHTKKGP